MLDTNTPHTSNYLDSSTGAIKWQRGRTGLGDGVPGVPTVNNGVIYIYPFGNYSGTHPLYALDETTGNTLWTDSARATTNWNSPTIANNTLYTIDETNINAVDITTHNKIWSKPNPLGRCGVIAVDNNHIYLQSSDAPSSVQALNITDGSPVWTNTALQDQTGRGGLAVIAVANGVVYAGTNNNNLYALNANTGNILWQYSAGGPIGIPIVANGALFVPSADGKIYAFSNNSTPTPLECSVTTSPSVQTLSVGGTAAISANVSSGLGSATVTSMRFGSYDTTLVTVTSPDDTSPYETTITAIAEGDTAVWATADLSDGRTCQSSGETDTDVTVTMLNPIITVSSPGEHFISSSIQDDAALPIRIHVENEDGAPIAGARIRLSNPNGILIPNNNATDSSGNLDASLPLPPSAFSSGSLADGDFTTEVIATISGRDYSSELITLYNAELIGSKSNIVTQAEVDNYPWQLLNYYVTKPTFDSYPCAGLNPNIKGLCYVLKAIDLYAKMAFDCNCSPPPLTAVTMRRARAFLGG